MAQGRSDEIRPPLSGWLVKLKNESAASRLLKRSNRRYFTLDFESHAFFYAHSEGGKVSFPTPFKTIVGVDPISNESGRNGDEDLLSQEVSASTMQRSTSKSSLTSLCILRMSGLTSAVKHHTAQFGFIVRTSGKSFELFCDTKEDADKWMQGFQDAMEIARSGAPSKRLDLEDLMHAELVSTSGGSSRCTTSRGSSHTSLGGSQKEMRTTDNVQNVPKQLQDVPSLVVAFDSRFVLDAPNAFEPVCALRQEASQVTSQESFFTLAKGYATPRSCDGASTLPLALAAPRSARSTSSGHRRSLKSSMNQVAQNAQSCWGRSAEDSVANRYGDKDKGLSICERLAQMEFSDDENSDEELTSSPRPIKDVQSKQGYVNMLQPMPPQPTSSIVVEACEAFVAPADDSDTD